MITLEDKAGEKIVLNPNMIWSDWGRYSPIEQAHSRTLDGSLVIETTAKKKGMPITLSAAPNQGLKYRKDVDPINKMMLENLYKPMILTMHNGERFPVLFSSIDGPPVEAVPLIEYADPINSDFIGLVLRFVVVDEDEY